LSKSNPKMVDLVEPRVNIIKNQSNDLAIFKCNFFLNYEIYGMCHHYIGTWASFHWMIQKTKHIISNHVWQSWPFEMNSSDIFKNWFKKIKLSQNHATCHNHDHSKWTMWNYCFSKKSICKIFQNCATCHNKKTLTWMIQIITHLQENKYLKSLKCGMCPQ
jgi:hypothetical protein